ncbi:septum site-determining protein MinC [Sulfobacillus harzensis]|uniref:Probable septum site-determining protein MinC n=1 Tax=Sulfobacillus harzensis TaxID=2729629 RepID=A0A7Y0L130_9FIRM|nr:septum site-determining protein MinC [Sulfobacillus harzensis]NMP21037.1 septum site-determining protein MinC [Sulfobacillus harzensis]
MEIKGDRRGLRLIAKHFSTNDDFVKELKATLHAKEEFLGRASLLIEVPKDALNPELFERITEAFQAFPNLSLRGIQENESPGVIAPLADRPAELMAPPKVVRHTIRSGQRLSHPGDLIIVGDVNPGATVTAGGDVMVFGWLRGSVYAGQPEDPSRVIYALRFDPSQVRIASVLALGNPEGSGNPEKALVEHGQLVVRPWHDVRLPEAITQDKSHWQDRFSSATPS